MTASNPKVTCRLCGTAFLATAQCHASCPLARGCAMIRCPSCGYETPDASRSTLARWLGAWLGSSPEAT